MAVNLVKVRLESVFSLSVLFDLVETPEEGTWTSSSSGHQKRNLFCRS